MHHMIDDLHVGGLMYRPDFAANIQDTHRKIQKMAKIPLLLAANVERGGDGVCLEGTSFGRPMAVAASGDKGNAYRMGVAACKEGAAVGLNWAFAPFVDIDMEFHNPITNVRTFGSNVDQIIEYASEYLHAADENDVAVSIKHFPGDGTDERDQHLVTSVNTLSTDDWDESYGRIYRTLIERGAKTVMVGHIAQPAWVKKINPEASHKALFMPATLSKELVTGLLRERLGFNGLISTDATPMVGFTSALPREQAIPQAINAGCDMILFNKSLDEDVAFLLSAVQNGIVSLERLNEAVERILATKASLKLPQKQTDDTIVPGPESIKEVGCSEHKAWAKAVAQNAITLVKDRAGLLPISPDKYPRIYLNIIQRDINPENSFAQEWKVLLEKEGFQVTLRDRTTQITAENLMSLENNTPEQNNMIREMYRSVREAKAAYDLYIYICNMENASNNTTLRLNWNVTFGMGDDAPWAAAEMPVVMISTAYPYHLFDAPMIPTYINAYSGETEFKKAVIDKLLGRSKFVGESPVDPFCGKEYIRLYGDDEQ